MYCREWLCVEYVFVFYCLIYFLKKYIILFLGNRYLK